MEAIKEISDLRKSVLEYLVFLAELDLPDGWNNGLRIRELLDGGMGSFQVFQRQVDHSILRTFGRRVSDYQFKDHDGVPVLVSLNLDSDGMLYEVDVWKTDYSPLLELKLPG